jgi:origin recognition complex subunit 6
VTGDEKVTEIPFSGHCKQTVQTSLDFLKEAPEKTELEALS